MHCTHHEENHIDAQDLHPQSEIPIDVPEMLAAYHRP